MTCPDGHAVHQPRGSVADLNNHSSQACALVCTLLRMQRERLTVSMQPQTAARVRQCGARIKGGASAYLEHLVRQDALREAAASAANWYAAHPTYAADSEAETTAALDETA